MLKKNKTAKLNVKFNLDDTTNGLNESVDEFVDEINKLDVELDVASVNKYC